MEEMWKDIPLSSYEISLSGLVRNKTTGTIHQGAVNDYGYPRVIIKKDGKRRSLPLHRLLLEVFVGPCPPGMEGRHLDGNRLNWSLDNLKWGTRSENRRDRTKHKRDPKGFHACPGELNYNAKLTDAKVLEIDSLISQGVPLIKIAKKFEVCTKTIYKIKRRETWKHLFPSTDKPIILEIYDPLDGISE